MLSYTETADFTSACAGWAAACFCWQQQAVFISLSKSWFGWYSGVLLSMEVCSWRAGQGLWAWHASEWVPARSSEVMESQLQ